jgi:hypothetical protein
MAPEDVQRPMSDLTRLFRAFAGSGGAGGMRSMTRAAAQGRLPHAGDALPLSSNKFDALHVDQAVDAAELDPGYGGTFQASLDDAMLLDSGDDEAAFVLTTGARHAAAPAAGSPPAKRGACAGQCGGERMRGLWYCLLVPRGAYF